MHKSLSLMKESSSATLNVMATQSEKDITQAYIRGVMQTADEISESGYKLDNAIVMAFILNGLPDGFRRFQLGVTAWRNFKFKIYRLGQ